MLNVTPLTLGTSGLGRATEPGSPEEQAAVETAVDLLTSTHGFVDTSNNYAAGRSEAVLGLAIARLGSHVGSKVISKVDSDPESGRFDRDRVLRSFDETVAKLGVERLSLLHLHDPYTVTFQEAMGPQGAVAGLIELRDSGRVGGIGVAAAPAPLMARYVGTGVFDAVLIHNRFTVVDQSAGPVFAEAGKRGMTVFNAAPFGSGILVTGAREGAVYDYRTATPELLAWVARLEAICAANAVSLSAVALQYSLRSPLVDSTVVGVARPGRRVQSDALIATAIPDVVWEELAGLGPAPSPIDDSCYA